MWLILAMQMCIVLNNKITPGIKNIMVYNAPQWYAVQEGDARMMLNEKKPGQKFVFIKFKNGETQTINLKSVRRRLSDRF